MEGAVSYSCQLSLRCGELRRLQGVSYFFCGVLSSRGSAFRSRVRRVWKFRGGGVIVLHAPLQASLAPLPLRFTDFFSSPLL